MAIVDEAFTNSSRICLLLLTEDALVEGAKKALDDIQQAIAAAGGNPSAMDPALSHRCPGQRRGGAHQNVQCGCVLYLWRRLFARPKLNAPGRSDKRFGSRID
jgi:hypothetical protein